MEPTDNYQERIPGNESRLLGVLEDHIWHPATELVAKVSHRFGAVIFTLRKKGHIIEKRHTGGGLYEYRLVQ